MGNILAPEKGRGLRENLQTLQNRKHFKTLYSVHGKYLVQKMIVLGELFKLRKRSPPDTKNFKM
jgi:hypothetical protein